MSTKIRIYAVVNDGSGKFPQVPVEFTRNGHAKPVPNACYYFFRRQIDGKRQFVKANTLDMILTKRANIDNPKAQEVFEALDQSEKAGISGLDAEIEEYLSEVAARRSLSTREEYARKLKVFREFCARKGVTSCSLVSRKHLLDYLGNLKNLKQGNGQPRFTDSGVHQHLLIPVIFLKARGFKNILEQGDWPRFTKPAVKAYTIEELRKLREAAKTFGSTPQGKSKQRLNEPEAKVLSAESLLLVDFLLGTGFRLSEVRVAEWNDIDWERQTIKVQAKPEFNFLPKSRDNRSVPISNELLASLKAAHKGSKTALIFPGNGGQPRAKSTVERHVAAIAKHAKIENVDVKTFRSTFATMRIQNHAVHDVQAYLGHKDITTTTRYLRVANLSTPETRQKTSATYAAVYE